MFDGSPAEAFAWRSPRAKAMEAHAVNPPSDEELIRMMLEVPYLIRRPIIRVAGETTFGFDRKQLEALLSELPSGPS